MWLLLDALTVPPAFVVFKDRKGAIAAVNAFKARSSQILVFSADA